MFFQAPGDMTKVRPYIFFLMVLVTGALVGFFKHQNNDDRVLIDALFGAEKFDWALGDALVLAWVIGFAFGAVLVAVHVWAQKADNRKLARQVRTLEKQLEKTREAARKESPR